MGVPVVILVGCSAIACIGLTALPVIACVRRRRYLLAVAAVVLCLLLPPVFGWLGVVLTPIQSIADTFIAPLVGLVVLVLSVVIVPLLILALVATEPEPEG
jgi:hypothetical protein